MYVKENYQSYSLGRKDGLPPGGSFTILMLQCRYAANPLPILYNHNPFPLLLSSMEKAHSMRSPNEREGEEEEERAITMWKYCVCVCVCVCVLCVCVCVCVKGELSPTECLLENPPETNLPIPPTVSPRPHPNLPRPNHTLGFL